MNIFFKNRVFRQITMNNWVSSFGDTLFYLAFINYVSSYKFAPLAILMITISETLPTFLGFFFGTLADFQKNRVKKNLFIIFTKVILYTIVTLVLIFTKFTIWSVVFICIINLISDTISSFNGSMFFPIYLRILKDDVAEAMGFVQATRKMVSVLGDFSGAILIGFLSIESIAEINVLTFLFAFLGIVLIRNTISSIEADMVVDKTFNAKNYFRHLKASLIKLFSMTNVVKLMTVSSLANAVLNTSFSIIVLILIKNPFMEFKTGQAVSLFSVVTMIAMLLGNLLTSKILTNISLKTVILLSQFCTIMVILGYVTYRFDLVLFSMAFACFINGLESPRSQAVIVKLIPEDAMGAINSAITLIDVTVPSVLTIVAVFFATTINIGVASIYLLVLVVFALIMTIRTEKFEY